MKRRARIRRVRPIDRPCTRSAYADAWRLANACFLAHPWPWLDTSDHDL